MAAIVELKYFNSFWLKKLDSIVEVEPTTGILASAVTSSPNITLEEANGNVGVGQTVSWEIDDVIYYSTIYKKNSETSFVLSDSETIPDATVLTFGAITDFTYIPNAYVAGDTDWSVEEARIRGGYNNTNVDLGVRAYIVEDNINQQHLQSGLIYSGIFNSRTGVNRTNEFPTGEDITRSLDPYNGSIQKLFSEDTNLIVFQEFKVSRALINKDAVYSAEGQPITTSSNQVIGQVQAYAGNYGIGTNPESFATYGYRKYFADPNRNAILRLSQDGITEISEYGMLDFFRDSLSSIGNNGLVLGMWDMHNKQYFVSIQKPLPSGQVSYRTLAFDEDVQGWTSFFSFRPDLGDSLRNNFYTFKDGNIYIHYSTNVNYATFYGTTYNSEVKLIFNPEVSSIKTFKTINYEGSTGWSVPSFFTATDTSAIISPAVNLITLADIEQQVFTNTFKSKENKYFANVINITPSSSGEIVWGKSMTGIKGAYATATVRYSNTAVPKRKGELFAVSSEYMESSY
tara:strand:+ start:603 stop:2144 length:1542 start_codon:yes stop_codon:yes gene_type:complete